MGEQNKRERKIPRVINEYGLHGLEDELGEYWTHESDQQMSLRELETYFNTRLVEAALKRESYGIVDGEAENYYRLLSDEEVLDASRIDAKHRLKDAGVDVEDLTSDFVSHQSIYEYLTEILEVSREEANSSPEERLDETLQTIDRLRNRLVAVTETSVKNLGEAGVLTHTDLRPIVLVELECEECGSRYPPRELFGQRTCDCK